MRCPFCSFESTRVVDSRLTEPGDSVRRRRECAGCGKRFTTHERMEAVPIDVIKRDGTTQRFDRHKLLRGLVRAAGGRPVGGEQLEELADSIAVAIRRHGKSGPAARIGDLAERGLARLDPVTAIQFASVYRRLADLDELEAVVRASCGKTRIRVPTRCRLMTPFRPTSSAVSVGSPADPDESRGESMPTSRSAAPQTAPNADGVTIERRFTEPGKHPFDAVEWEIRDAVIGDPSPPSSSAASSSPRAGRRTRRTSSAQKYFRGRMGSRRARALGQADGRAAWPAPSPRWGREGGYFATDEDADTFEAELTHILLHQMAAFNSPVWFNVGFEEHPQCSACFIL